MSFTIIIPFLNGHEYLDKLLSSIPNGIDIIVIDDMSDSAASISRPNTRVHRLREKGYFTGAINAGIKSCNTDVLILNQDTYFNNDTWLNFIDENRNRYDIFGESAGSHPAWPNRYVHGTFMYIKRDVIDNVGLMDAVNYPLWGSTCEYQLRACRKGFKANPVSQIPGFVHKRIGSYGSAIRQLLSSTDKRGKFIMTPPMVSVIITCYNYGRYLKDAVNSLVGGKTSLGDTPGQSLQSFEIIIVDDGSTDGSARVAEKLANPMMGIHLVTQGNKGSAAAVNAGIVASHARNDGLIAIMDADDMMEPRRLERMVATWNNNRHSVIYDNIQFFGYGQRGIVVDWETGKKIDKLGMGTYDFDALMYRNAGQMHKGLLYPKRAWEESGGYPEIMNKGREDWAFNIALGIKGWCGVNTGEYDYLYRREGQNRTITNTNPKAHLFFFSQIKSLFPAIYAGERPPMCCGRSNSQGKQRSDGGIAMANRLSKDLPGQNGMVILIYIGSNHGDQTWHGPVTGTRYVLGGVRKRGRVDRRDAYGDPKSRIVGMLEMKENGKNVFIEEKQVKAKPVVKHEVLPTEIATIDEQPVEQPVIKSQDYSEYTLLSVSKLKNVLGDMSPDDLGGLLVAEKSGQNRSTAIKAIEAAIDVHLA